MKDPFPLRQHPAPPLTGKLAFFLEKFSRNLLTRPISLGEFSQYDWFGPKPQ
jgi:hypothetical protein